MLQASVTYNTTEYSNSTIENVSAPLSGKYGQVIFCIWNPDKFSLPEPVWIQNFHDNWLYFKSFLCTAGFSIELSEDSKLTLGRIQLQPFKVPEDTFANPVICPQGEFKSLLSRWKTIFLRYFCCYPRNCWNYFGSPRYFGFGKF